MLMKISEQPLLSNPSHGADLPPSWRTLCELTKLADLEAATSSLPVDLWPAPTWCPPGKKNPDRVGGKEANEGQRINQVSAPPIEIPDVGPWVGVFR
jgi:hypothetical protein